MLRQKREGPMAKRYIVTLTEEARADLLALTKKGKISARKLIRAHVLLQADAGARDEAMAAALHMGIATVERIRKRFVEEGLEASRTARPRPGGQRTRDGQQEACLIALACSPPPEGRKCWTMPLLADRLVALGIVEALADETVRRTLKKTRANRG
jgi:transposase